MTEFKWIRIAMSGWRCETKQCAVEIFPRPYYCDRGRWQAHVLCPGHPVNPNPFDAADKFPRYYFNLDRAKAEMEDLFLVRNYESAS